MPQLLVELLEEIIEHGVRHEGLLPSRLHPETRQTKAFFILVLLLEGGFVQSPSSQVLEDAS